MGEMMIAYDNRAGLATTSDGEWVTTMPASNLLDPQPGVVARTAGLAPGQSRVTLKWDKEQPLRAVALANHNIRLNGTYRLRLHSEGAMENLFTYTEDLTGAGWSTVGGVTVSPNAALAPDGLMSMDVVSDDSAVTSLYMTQEAPIPAGPDTYTVSIFLRPGTAEEPFIQVGIRDASSWLSEVGYYIYWPDPGNELSPPQISTGIVGGARLDPMGDGTFRFSVQVTNPGMGTYVRLTLLPAGWAPNTGTTAFWGASCTREGSVSSYYPSLGGTPATRPAHYFDSWQSYEYDSGWIDVWPTIYETTDEVEWENDNFWDGRYLQDEIEGYMWTLSHILPRLRHATSLSIEFLDANNPDGFIQAGVIFAGPAWQPVYNASFGATLGWEDETEVQTAISGAEFFDVKVPFRVANFRFPLMTEDEGMAGPFEIMRRMGIHGTVVFFWDPDDTKHATRRQFIGRLRTLSPLEFPEGFIDGHFRTTVPMQIKELVA